MLYEYNKEKAYNYDKYDCKGKETTAKSQFRGEGHLESDKYSQKRFDIQSLETIDVAVLEAIPFEYPASNTEVTYETEEFTAVCPWTGLPDFAKLTIKYIPDQKLVELKSLKYYLTSFRNVGILQEHAINRILEDLVKLLSPTSMSIEAEYKERGGIHTRAVVRYPKNGNNE